MPKKVRTAKGQIIDFDLLKIKEQMVDSPKPTNVQARQDFIDQKMRRRVKRVKDQLLEAKKNPVVDVAPELEVKSAEQGPKIDEIKEIKKPQKRKIKKKTVTKK